MASEILIRFKTAALDRASEAASKIKANLNAAIKTIQDPAFRTAFRKQVVQEQKVERQAQRERAGQLDALRARGAELNAGEPGEGLAGIVGHVRKGVHIANALRGAIQRDDPIASLGELARGLGAVAATVNPLAGIAVAIIGQATAQIREIAQAAAKAEAEAIATARLADLEIRFRAIDEELARQRDPATLSAILEQRIQVEEKFREAGWLDPTETAGG